MKNKYRIAKVLRGNNKTYYVPQRKSWFKWVTLLKIDDPGFTTENGALNALMENMSLEVEYIYPEFEKMD